MLWSVMPENVVFGGADADIRLLEGRVGSCDCRLRCAADGSLSIERLMSTDPADYLRRELAPGQRVHLR